MFMNRISVFGTAAAAAAVLLLSAGAAFAQSAPSLKTGVAVSPNILPGTHSAVALIELDASQSGSDIRVNSLGVSASFAGGATASTLTNCSIAYTDAIGNPLNSGTNAVASLSGTSTFTFNAPVAVPAGGAANLALVCDVSAGASANSSITIGIEPSAVAASDASTGTSIIPTITGMAGYGQTSGTAIITTGGSSGSTGAGGSTTTPGLPDTGAGGDAARNAAVLGLCALALMAGAALFVRYSRKEA